jgi:hypothetical protein
MQLEILLPLSCQNFGTGLGIVEQAVNLVKVGASECRAVIDARVDGSRSHQTDGIARAKSDYQLM